MTGIGPNPDLQNLSLNVRNVLIVAVPGLGPRRGLSLSVRIVVAIQDEYLNVWNALEEQSFIMRTWSKYREKRS